MIIIIIAYIKRVETNHLTTPLYLSIFVANVSKMNINILYKFHIIPNTQSRFIKKSPRFTGTTLLYVIYFNVLILNVVL